MRTSTRRMAHATPRPRRGMALAMVMVFMFTLTVALAAGFMVNAGERRVDDDGLQAANVMAMAEGGLDRAMTDRAAIGLATPPVAPESVRVNVSGGTVDVIETLIRPVVGSQPALYLMRSHAQRTQKTAGSEATAQETLTELAAWQVGSMNVNAGWSSLSGITKNGASGTISGVDQCGKKPSVAAVSVPANPGYVGSQSPLAGSTPLIDTTGATAAASAAANPVNWAGIVSGTAMTPTYTVPPDAFPAAALFNDSTFWPIIKIVNPPPAPPPLATNPAWTLPYQGQGMLIVEGDMVISGSNMWNGIVLVGGTITSNGNNSVDGATSTGLNVKLGYTVGMESVGNGTKHFQYNSCWVQKATATMGSMRTYSNTWSTSFPTY
jgi:hypothetical protein